MKEIWKDIKGYEGKYQISNLGRVKSLNYNNTKKEKIIKSEITKGYVRYRLSKNKKLKRFLAHRLVAEAFIPNPNNYPIINHIDGNPLNNDIKNLEWCTYKYNAQHALKTGLVEMHSFIMKDKKTKKTLRIFKNLYELQENIKLPYYSHIYNCCKGTRKSAYGYIWEFGE